jgi:hypothetical protein
VIRNQTCQPSAAKKRLKIPCDGGDAKRGVVIAIWPLGKG